MSKDKPGTNWSSAEWLKVAAMAHGLIEQGQTHRDAVLAAQMAVLPRSRWRETAKLSHAVAPSMTTWPKYLKQVQSMSPDERTAVLLADAPPPVGTPVDPPPAPPPPPPVVEAKKPKKPKESRLKPYGTSDKRVDVEEGHIVRWTSREWALIARAAKWVSEHSPGLPLPRQVNEAQVWTLEPDRLRPYSSIVQSYHGRKNGQRILALQLAAGLERGWTINSVEFNPPGSKPEKQEPEVLAPPPVEVGQSPEADTLTTAAPATGGALPSSNLTEAARTFGETMMRALDTLLHTHSQHLLGQVNDRIGAMATDMGTQVAGMIEAAMRRTVHSMVEQELGGPVSPPVPPADEPASVETSAPIPGETPPRKRLKVDVVGTINGPVKSQVRDQFNGVDIDLRFFDGGHHQRYKPDPNRHTIFLSGRASHGLFDKLKKYKIQPIYVEPSVSFITHAIDELQRSAMQ